MNSSGQSQISNQRSVLILSRDGIHREPMRKTLHQLGFKVDFSGTLNSAFDLLISLEAGILIHDWNVSEATQNAAFQQRLARNSIFQALVRVLLSPQLSPAVLALAHDCGIRRVLTYATSNLNLGNEIEMMLAANNNMSDLQKFAHDIKMNEALHNQSFIDEQIEAAWQQFSHDPMVKIEFGNLCFRRNQWKQSQHIAKELLKDDDTNVRALSLLARVLIKNQRHDDAVRLLEKANNLSPKNVERLIDLGNCFSKTGNISRAREVYSEAVEMNPASKTARVELGRAFISEGNVDHTMKLFTEGLSDDETASYFNMAAISAVHDGKMEEALLMYETALAALRSSTQKAIIHFNIAIYHKKQNNFDSSARHLRHCLSLNPEHTKAQGKLMEVEGLIAAAKRI